MENKTERSFCGEDCASCGFGKSRGCRGCVSSDGCPFGKACFIAGYLRTGGEKAYRDFLRELTEEINALGISGMPEITELNPLSGAYINLSYPLPNGTSVKLLDDRDFYLGCQVPCLFNDGSVERFYGVAAQPGFLLVSEYGPNGADPELLLFKKR